MNPNASPMRRLLDNYKPQGPYASGPGPGGGSKGKAGPPERGGGTPSRGELPGQDREPRPAKEPSGNGAADGSPASNPEAPKPPPTPPETGPRTGSSGAGDQGTFTVKGYTEVWQPDGTRIIQYPDGSKEVVPAGGKSREEQKKEDDERKTKEKETSEKESKEKESNRDASNKPPEKEKKKATEDDEEDINKNQNTTKDNPQEDGGDERPYKRVFIPTATDKFLLIAALRAAQEVNKRTPKPGTDTGWQPFGSGSGTVARAPEQSSGSYLPDAAAGQMMMASSYEGAGRSRFRSPATDGPDQVPLGAARQRDRSKGRGVMSWFRPNPDDPNPSPRPNARARQG